MSVHESELSRNIQGYEEFSIAFNDIPIANHVIYRYKEMWHNHEKINERYHTHKVAQSLSQLATEFNGDARKLMNLATQQLLELKIESEFWKCGHKNMKSFYDEKAFFENKALRDATYKLSRNYPGKYMPETIVYCANDLTLNGQTEIIVRKGTLGVVKSTETSILTEGRIAILFNKRADGKKGVVYCLPKEIELETDVAMKTMNKELQTKVALLNQQKEKLMKTRSEKEAKLEEELKGKEDILLNEKEKFSEILKDQDEKFNKRITHLNNIIEGKNGRIETLKNKIESKDIEEYEKKIKELKIDLHKAKETISSSKRCVKKLKNQIQDKIHQMEAQGSKMKKMKESQRQREDEMKISKQKEASKCKKQTLKWKGKYKKLKEELEKTTLRLNFKGSQSEEILRAVLEDLEVEQSKVKDIQKGFQDKLESVRKELRDEETNFKCVACLDETPCGMYMPCQHAVYCEDCLDQVPADATCPLCRTLSIAHLAFANKPK